MGAGRRIRNGGDRCIGNGDPRKDELVNVPRAGVEIGTDRRVIARLGAEFYLLEAPAVLGLLRSRRTTTEAVLSVVGTSTTAAADRRKT